MRPTAEANRQAIENDDRNQPPEEGRTKKRPIPTDPMLRYTAKLDRILAEMPEDMRTWAVSWLMIKYGRARLIDTIVTKNLGGERVS